MDETIKSDGYLVGIIAVVLGVLKFLFGKARTASNVDKCEAIKNQLEEFEGKMNTALREIRLDISEMKRHQDDQDESASEQRRKVSAALDDMNSALQSFKRAVNSVLDQPPQSGMAGRLR